MGPPKQQTRNTMAHTHTNLLIHAVFSTKHRYPFLTDHTIRSQLHSYMGGILKHNGAQPIQINGLEEHVHLLFGMPPDANVAALVKESKRASSIWIKTKGPAYKQFAWQTGYGAFSVSESAKNSIRVYIIGQVEHHQKTSFEDEWTALMKANALPPPEWDHDKR